MKCFFLSKYFFLSVILLSSLTIYVTKETLIVVSEGLSPSFTYCLVLLISISVIAIVIAFAGFIIEKTCNSSYDNKSLDHYDY